MIGSTLHPTEREPFAYLLTFLAVQRLGVMRIAAAPKGMYRAACIDALTNAA